MNDTDRYTGRQWTKDELLKYIDTIIWTAPEQDRGGIKTISVLTISMKSIREVIEGLEDATTPKTQTIIDKIDSRHAMWLWNDSSDLEAVDYQAYSWSGDGSPHLHNSTGACFHGWADGSIEKQKHFLLKSIGDELFSQASAMVIWKEDF